MVHCAYSLSTTFHSTRPVCSVRFLTPRIQLNVIPPTQKVSKSVIHSEVPTYELVHVVGTRATKAWVSHSIHHQNVLHKDKLIMGKMRHRFDSCTYVRVGRMSRTSQLIRNTPLRIAGQSLGIHTEQQHLHKSDLAQDLASTVSHGHRRGNPCKQHLSGTKVNTAMLGCRKPA
jgi:hypothetical protein